MASERVQRSIDVLLDEAAAAIAASDWERVADRANNVLALDPSNADARSFVEAADRALAARRSRPASMEPATQPTPPAGQPSSFVSGRYKVVKFLGQGGKKKVYLAHDTTLDRDVAFALIKTEGLDAAGRERITREAQAMGRMGTHPHIVSVFDLGTEGEQPYIVTELLVQYRRDQGRWAGSKG